METYHFTENKHLTSLSLSSNQPLEHYPGGMLMPGRSIYDDKYRFGFNGKENDNEIKGVGNSQDYGMRIYDPRIIRFNSVDPLTRKYPYYTPYQFAGNKLIEAVDLDGKEEWKVNQTTTTSTTTSSSNSASTTTSTTNKSSTAHGPYRDEKAVADAVSSGMANLSNVNTSTTTTTTTPTTNSSLQLPSIEQPSKFLDNAAVLTGAVSTGYDIWKSSLTTTSTTVNGIGTGLSVLSTVFGGAQVYQQYKDGGISNVNVFDAANATIGATGTVICVMQWFEIGTTALSTAGEAITPIGLGVSSLQAWYGLYKSMDKLNYAPSYIDGNGQPCYFEPKSDADLPPGF